MSFITRGFKGRRTETTGPPERIPPGQYLTADFPVLSAGPTPRIPLEDWALTVIGRDGREEVWTWNEFKSLPSETFTVDIHCVTKWSKLDTTWEGVPCDALFEGLETGSGYGFVASHGGYTTNIPVADLTGGRAWVAYAYEGRPLEPEHGGPARLVVPHLYLWKSAKWVKSIRILEADRPGFWESYGYHIYGDPWKEQRYSGD
jgi:DMSO/TMAO reductase YedYZ molybdopterin-dependent catalytic subunit